MTAKYFQYIALLMAAFVVPTQSLLLARPALAASNSVVISEVAPDGGASASQEFIELYNNSSLDVVLQGWVVQVRSANGALNKTLALGDKVVRSHSYVLLASTNYTTVCPSADYTCFSATMSASGGQVTVVNNSGAIVDKLGWGTANDYESTAAAAPLFGAASLTRKTTATATLQDTDNNAQDFDSFTAHTPTGGGLYTYVPIVDVCPNIAGVQETVPTGYELVGENCQLIPTPEPEPTPTPTPPPTCQGISITEIVPNPSGEDTGKEYIELFNDTTSPVDLTGCLLKVGSSQQALSGLMQPGYRAVYGLVLPNAAGGQVQFVTSTTSQTVNYPANLGDDEAYGLVDGVWKQGLTPTPGARNTTATSTTDQEADTAALEPCPPGKYRSIDTNRCRNIEAESTLTPCNPGQVRNAETNRCRNATTASTALAACGPGETRNADTNRCRKNTASTTTPAACQPGQERNPDTNRCRKVAAAKSTNPMATPAQANPKPVSFYVLGLVAALAAGYAIYEYRHSVYNYVARIRKRLQQS